MDADTTQNDTAIGSNNEMYEMGIEEDNKVEVAPKSSSAQPKVRWYTVNRHMVPAKVSYFVNGARFEISSYLMLFYTSSGLSPFQAGILNGLQYLGGMIGNPAWGLLADKHGYRRTIICFLSLMATIAALVQPLLIQMYGDRDKNVCHRNSSETNTFNVTHHVVKETNNQSSNNLLFFSLLACAILFMFFEGSISSLIDAAVLKRTQTSPRKAEVGMQRYCHSIGVSIGSICYSFSISYFPQASVSCYVGIFIAYLLFSISTIITCFPLYRGVTITAAENIKRDQLINVLLQYIKQFDTVMFLLNVFFTGIFQALLFSFLFIFLKELNSPTMLFGFSIALNSVSAVTVYCLSERIIRRLGGPLNALCVSCFAWGLRLICTAYLSSPYYVLAIDIFHGFTYSLGKVASLDIIKHTADDVIFNTMCGINNLLFISCGFLFANIFGGKLYEIYGGKKVFLGTGLTCVAWGCINVIYLFLRKRTQKRIELKGHTRQK